MKVEKNRLTGGFCARFRHNNSYYYADQSIIPGYLPKVETMIFTADKEGNVTCWNEVFVEIDYNRLPSEISLIEYIEKFKKNSI